EHGVADATNRLRGRPRARDRVTFPRHRGALVLPASPKIGDDFALDDDREARTDLAAINEVLQEGLAKTLVLWRALALGLDQFAIRGLRGHGLAPARRVQFAPHVKFGICGRASCRTSLARPPAWIARVQSSLRCVAPVFRLSLAQSSSEKTNFGDSVVP